MNYQDDSNIKAKIKTHVLLDNDFKKRNQKDKTVDKLKLFNVDINKR